MTFNKSKINFKEPQLRFIKSFTFEFKQSLRLQKLKMIF